ncbi:uncharacterized protein G2W53_002227 [Senna tora]|uniref:Uncharacterized protein n=1 Tax=Senna tora TaxID=362788 RepID=A0A834XHR2_9FABA|nr:uncharacterized protein G2W53_002227 [Senna tora]
MVINYRLLLPFVVCIKSLLPSLVCSADLASRRRLTTCSRLLQHSSSSSLSSSRSLLSGCLHGTGAQGSNVVNLDDYVRNASDIQPFVFVVGRTAGHEIQGYILMIMFLYKLTAFLTLASAAMIQAAETLAISVPNGTHFMSPAFPSPLPLRGARNHRIHTPIVLGFRVETNSRLLLENCSSIEYGGNLEARLTRLKRVKEHLHSELMVEALHHSPVKLYLHDLMLRRWSTKNQFHSVGCWWSGQGITPLHSVLMLVCSYVVTEQV